MERIQLAGVDGDLFTFDGAVAWAKAQGANCTYWALYRWATRHDLQKHRVGRNVLLRAADVQRYVDVVRTRGR